jgi:hypothetical protein
MNAISMWKLSYGHKNYDVYYMTSLSITQPFIKTNKNMKIDTTYKSVYAKHIFSLYHEKMWMWIMVLKMKKGGLHVLTKY